MVVLYEDDTLLAVSKPSGLAVHGGAGETGRTLIDLVSECYGGRVEVHLAHRIDKDTSGLVVIAKTKEELKGLQASWDAVEKRYLAIALGKIEGPRTIDRALTEKDGRSVSALTRITPRQVLSGIAPETTLVEAEIVTGRTHQIRRHLAGIGHPVLLDDKHGDFKANKAWSRALKARDLRVKHLCLHGWRAVLPRASGSLALEAPLPPSLEQAIAALGERIDSGD